jgi:hypothetical protein
MSDRYVILYELFTANTDKILKYYCYNVILFVTKNRKMYFILILIYLSNLLNH